MTHVCLLLRRWLFPALTCVPLVLGGCSSDDAGSERCPPAHSHPTFRLRVRAATGPLPPDVRITVKYGSGVEEFDATSPPVDPQAVFCQFERSDSDALEGGHRRGDRPQAVLCELWTDGAARVHVRASGYEDIERDLVPETDRCGLVLTVEELVLERQD